MMMLQLFHHIHFIIPTMLYFSNDVVKTDNVQGTSSEQTNQQHNFYNLPYVASNYTANVTYQIGTHAFLHCKIQQLGNRSVSWVRVDNQNIISVDRESYIASERYIPYLKETSNQWSLQIKFVEPQDAGLYECQVAVEPKVSSRIQLYVTVPVTEITGDSDRYVKAGSNVTLTCIVSAYVEPPRFIIWYQDATKILAENYRGTIREEKKFNDTSPISISKLTIPSTKKMDSGNYTCSPTNADSATISLHVINSAESASAVTSSGCTHGFYVKVYGLFLVILLSCQHT
ncbi:zwei Ig domain protein zig-8-like isoform X2 [Bradysia coprophila]|uniref:zwei Ig domain protein zig-8-like isoform X2 n=1 Tax=Bradysia coprophila TaxID=38358 RepID=UPI00187D7337|nr:zwei Ig domain protein zig-8-like isoform X2 [Bradysia coprophila]